MNRGFISANLDREQSFQELLKSDKILKDLQKGVASLKPALPYPSILQKAAIPVLNKEGQKKNVILKYDSLNGVKLSVLIPLIDR